ncbi:MAG: hypothetical protein IMY69_03165 [Bacteroidetes bacterium]|nr:hypothetical protein [Bacteroidota bacterium]
MARARIIIKEGIKPREPAGEIKLMALAEKEIKNRIEVAIDAILAETEYERMKENPPTIGVEKDTV